ncbi:MAG: ferrous iron transport protein, partial [candidate division NC10 bacterium]|nr:ferrous iron transport protein [candidate division NC10 bacterium]MBS1115859.1 ferrous iron transport protein [candidate division NC10 bacterium]
MSTSRDAHVEEILTTARTLRSQLGTDFHEQLVEAVYATAARITDRAVIKPGEKARLTLDRTIDRLVTSRLWGFPIMFLLFAVMFWLTISGANVPSAMIAWLLIDTIYPLLREGAAAIGLPWWLWGLVIDGMYLGTAWVLSVMLPPMA